MKEAKPTIKALALVLYIGVVFPLELRLGIGYYLDLVLVVLLRGGGHVGGGDVALAREAVEDAEAEGGEAEDL